jgi:precorrin-6B methylase 2
MTTEETKTPESGGEEIFKLAPFNPSSAQIQEKAIEHLSLSAKDVLFDLGCGDGRLLVAAAEKVPGLRCVGVEMDIVFVTRALVTIESLTDDLKSRIDIREGDVLKLENEIRPEVEPASIGEECRRLTLMEDATAIYLFILPKGIVKIMSILEAIVQRRQEEKRDFRILSYMFKIHEWEPTIVDRTSKGDCPIYLYDFKFANEN